MNSPRRVLPSAEVRFEPDFAARLAALQGRWAGLFLRREGAGPAAWRGPGEDLVGFRPYRPGEDLRQLDWNLLARLDKPFVRVTRREAGENWMIALDASASMGVGPPGKLQRGAECAAALACLGARQGHSVRVLLSSETSTPREFLFRVRQGLTPLFQFLEGARAEGRAGLQSVLSSAPLFREASHVFCVGDLLDVRLESVVALKRGAREVSLLQLLAPIEFDPGLGNFEWWDPESDERLRLQVGAADLSRYHALLDQRLESWRVSAAAHRIPFTCRSTVEEFETLVSPLLRG